MLFSQRRTLHRTIAEHYENNKKMSMQYGALAHHWLGTIEDGGDTKVKKTVDTETLSVLYKVVNYLKRLAKKSAKVSGKEAERYFEQVTCALSLLIVLGNQFV